jgi:2-(1,2-epoxy-1,2-dihydrophenyl)acetyl-CoA isomerase
MSQFEHILTETADGIGTLTLNRPDKLNAFAGRMRQELADGVAQMASDDGVRCLVITGAGRAFCAGADIGYMTTLMADGDEGAFAELVEAGRKAVTAIRTVPKPVIASLNGPAAGGGANLALACDLRIASDRATIGQTFNRIGLHPDWGGTYFLPRLVGTAKAIELVFSGGMVSAEDAERLGLFSHVVPHDQLQHETRRLARTLADKPPLALALAKRAIYSSERRGLSEMLDVELEHQLQCFRSQDAKEGLKAFLEKRAPTFQGR